MKIAIAEQIDKLETAKEKLEALLIEELQYHKLRAKAIERELLRREIDVD